MIPSQVVKLKTWCSHFQNGVKNSVWTINCNEAHGCLFFAIVPTDKTALPPSGISFFYVVKRVVGRNKTMQKKVMDMSTSVVTATDDMINLKATELRLGLPGATDDEYHAGKHQKGSNGKSNKRVLSHETLDDDEPTTTPRPKAQIVGWPPVRSYRNNAMQEKSTIELRDKATRNYVKVSVDGEPFLRKMNLGLYKGYAELLKALEAKLTTIGDFSESEGYRKNASNYEPTYEDKDGDWMLVGDVPWEMFLPTCRRLRIKMHT